jgi:hypothetical protein
VILTPSSASTVPVALIRGDAPGCKPRGDRASASFHSC